jgi:hypothetical protein
MILVCFPHYTAGGLLCDIFTNTKSVVESHGGLGNTVHSNLKVGDSESVQRSLDLNEFNKKFEELKDTKTVFGTHCWAEYLPCEKFDTVINVTTQTNKSKIYRWSRAFYHYYIQSMPWQIDDRKQLIDKQRETAKNYFIPQVNSTKSNVINIEFEDIVEETSWFRSVFLEYPFIEFVKNWKNNNQFLYSRDFWNSTPVDRFREAEYEIITGQHYYYE